MARVGVGSLVIIALAAAGITARQIQMVDDICGDVFRHCRAEIDRVFSLALGHAPWTVSCQPDIHCPGPTWALVVEGGRTVGLDAEGWVTSCDGTCDLCGLPVLTGFSLGEVWPGRKVTCPEVISGLGLVRAFEQMGGLMEMLSEINLRDLECPKAILCGGVVVEFGRGDYLSKLERLNQALNHLSELEAVPRRIDLRFRGQVVVDCDRLKHKRDKEV